MDIYLSGVVLSFLLNLYQVLVNLFGLFSTKTRNFKKVNLYFNPYNGGYSKNKPTLGVFVLFVLDGFILTPLGSWLSVAWIAFSYIKIFVNKVPVPEKIKEVNYKLSSIELPKDKVKECLKEISTFYGMACADFRSLSDDEHFDNNKLILDEPLREDDWTVWITLDKVSKQYTYVARSPDYIYKHTSIHEYSFSGSAVFSREVEHKYEYAIDVNYDIKNGTVLESDVRRKFEETPPYARLSDETIDEKIEKLRKRTEWSPEAQRIGYFILFRHGEIMPDNDLKKYFQAEVERIRCGCTRVEMEVAKLNWIVVPCDYDDMTLASRIRVIDESSNKTSGEIDSLREDMSKYGITPIEFNDCDRITKELNLYISRLD